MLKKNQVVKVKKTGEYGIVQGRSRLYENIFIVLINNSHKGFLESELEIVKGLILC